MSIHGILDVYRPSFVTHLQERGADILEQGADMRRSYTTRQELLGHEGVQTPMFYTHVLNR